MAFEDLQARTRLQVPVFTVPRQLVSARTHRLFRAEAFETWREAASVVV
jgi:hypothetical protein